jgi:hypothetical protein
MAKLTVLMGTPESDDFLSDVSRETGCPRDVVRRLSVALAIVEAVFILSVIRILWVIARAI